MAAGLLTGAMTGLGKALQHNAQNSLEEKRQAALLKLKEQATIRAEEREGERAAAATAAEWAREDQQRQQDREWKVIDSKRDHARDLALQRLRNQRGYGSGPTANMREAQWLVDQGIATDLGSAWPMVSSRADQSGESIDYVESRIEELESVLKDPTVLYEGVGSDDANEEEVQAAVQRRAEQLRSELEFFRGKRDELAAERYRIRPPGLLSQGQHRGEGSGGGGGGEQPAPSSQQGTGGPSSVDDILNSVLR